MLKEGKLPLGFPSMSNISRAVCDRGGGWIPPWHCHNTCKPHLPAFFSSAPRKTASSHNTDTCANYRTISTFNKCFGQNIIAHTTGMHSIKFGDGNANCGIITDSFNTHTTVYKSDEDTKIIRWLSPLEPNQRHQGVRTDRFGGIGDWLLETSEFQEWRGGVGGADTAVLFCSGNPGVGKTYMR